MASFVGHPPDDDPPPLPPAVAPSSCVCMSEEDRGGTKIALNIKDSCNPIEDGGPKICLDELNPFANDSNIALSIVTLPAQKWLDKNTTPDDIEEKTEQYILKSIKDIQEEIKRHIEFYNFGLAPAIKGIIVITKDGAIWFEEPALIDMDEIHTGKSIIEVIIIMVRCNKNPFSISDVESLIRQVANKNYLYSDFTPGNVCSSSDSLGRKKIKLIDFEKKYIADPEFVTDSEFVDKVNILVRSTGLSGRFLMTSSMLLIFIMSTYYNFMLNDQASDNKYADLLSDFNDQQSELNYQGQYRATDKENEKHDENLKSRLKATIEYLALYETIPNEETPLGRLIRYTWWGFHYTPTDISKYVRRTVVKDERYEEAIAERIKLLEIKNKKGNSLIKDMIVEQIFDILKNRIPSLSGGSKRKTRRRIKKRGKKGKTRRR
jgi:hypothetical protein